MEEMIKENLQSDILERLQSVVKYNGYVKKGSEEAIKNIQNGACSGISELEQVVSEIKNAQ